MTTRDVDLAIFGRHPAFERPLPVGQLNFPDWERVESAFRGIFARRYYTNHGPLAQELEKQLSSFLSVKHVVCMTNATIGLMIAAKALGLEGKVITPAFTFIATGQSLTWAGLEPVFCDLDPATHQISTGAAAALIDDDVCAILGVHLWGDVCDIDELQVLATQHGLKLYFDAAHAFGCARNGVPIGSFGDLEVFSFHATKVLSSMEGGCVCTNDDQIAARLRNIRSSYGAGPPVDIPYTGNGRMSEAQAAMALLSLEDYPKAQARNRMHLDLFNKLLGGIPGIRMVRPAGISESNYQYVVLEVTADQYGIDRDLLARVLHADNIMSRSYFAPGLHRSVPYRDDLPQYRDALPETDRLCSRVLQLPSGQPVSTEAIERICNLIALVHDNAATIRDTVPAA